jgi:DnaJ-class molecular chaperone
MFDSLKILGLGYAATYAEVKAKYRAMARMYHPDQHNPERTGLTHSQAVQLFKLINNAHEYLRSKLN